MSLNHKITGYDRRTERLVYAHSLQSEHLSAAKIVAHVPPEDEDAIGSYPLDEEQARVIARKIGTEINVDAYEWFLEPSQAA